MKREKNKILLGIIIFGVILTIIPLGLIYYGDIVLTNWKTVSFEDPAGERLEGTYYPGSRDIGVILLEGYAADQTSLKGIATEFARLGFHVFTFDFSGQGRSSGVLEFSYTQSDRLAKQVIAGKEKFKSISGLSDSQIILFGHSMGARAALQSIILEGSQVRMLILFGCFLNLETNLRYGYSRMPSDSELGWVKSLSKNNPPVDTLILTGEFDDVLPPYRAQLLYQRLGGKNSKYVRDLVIVNNLIHGYEIFSPETISYTLNWVIKNLDMKIVPNYIACTMVMRKIFWTLSIIGVFLTTIVGNLYLMNNDLKTQKELQDVIREKNRGYNDGMRITSLKRFLKYKVLIWFAAIPIYIGLLLLFFTIPLGYPYISLIAVSSIGGYGILLILLHGRGKMPGTAGTLITDLRVNKKALDRNVLKASVIAILLIFLSTIFAQTGLFYVFPLNDRLMWLIILTIFTIPGFYIMDQELKSFNNSTFKTLKQSDKIALFFN